VASCDGEEMLVGDKAKTEHSEDDARLSQQRELRELQRTRTTSK